MSHQDLDIMADVVERAVEGFRQHGLITTDRQEFIVSRLIEYGIRGYSVGRIEEVVGFGRTLLWTECSSLGLPTPRLFRTLGQVLYVVEGQGRATGRRGVHPIAREAGLNPRTIQRGASALCGEHMSEIAGDLDRAVDGFITHTWREAA